MTAFTSQKTGTGVRFLITTKVTVFNRLSVSLLLTFIALQDHKSSVIKIKPDYLVCASF